MSNVTIDVSLLKTVDVFKKWCKEKEKEESTHKCYFKQGDYFLEAKTIIHNGKKSLLCTAYQFENTTLSYNDAFKLIPYQIEIIKSNFARQVAKYLYRHKLGDKFILLQS